MKHSWSGIQYARTSDLQADAAKELISNLAIKHDENVLDLGCGLGNLTMDIAAIAHDGDILGIDTSPSMIEQAQSNLQLRPLPNVKFQVASANDLHFDGYFDIVFSNSVFHWIAHYTPNPPLGRVLLHKLRYPQNDARLLPSRHAQFPSKLLTATNCQSS